MAKTKTIYYCKECGNESSKWFGKCNACGQWNTCLEGLENKKGNTPKHVISGLETGKTEPILVQDIQSREEDRINMNNGELNRVLGGGLVKGSLVLIGGEPGIGKSTLLLQTALQLPKQKILYISGEESASQLKLRADRITKDFNECYIISETSLEQIYIHIKNTKPDLVIVDSIQTIHTDTAESSPGSITQIRECATSLLHYAKENDVPTLLVGHITKDGAIAGPKLLEHIVDTVLQFEGDQHYMYRILRATKNRFGSTSELGIFEMKQNGLREVSNPSEFLLSQNKGNLSGIAVAAAIEGVRPLLIEVQALTSTAAYGTPQRSTTGFDLRRLNMLLAVLEKRAGVKIGQKDVFLNIAGGLKVNDTAIDLTVITAILSSHLDIAVDKQTCLAGEIGLSGEIRSVNRIEQRISEANKLGFKRIVIPQSNIKGLSTKQFSIEIKTVSQIDEAFRLLFS